MTALENILNQAERKLWLDFQSASEYKQNGNIGTSREDTVISFLREHLPKRYELCSGEAVDSQGNHTGQIDIMIYDGSSTCPLVSTGKDCILPSEALLAVIEVKSSLNKNEVDKCIKGFNKVHTLKPWGNPWSVPRKKGSAADDNLPRVLTSIFAYKTDLAQDNWAKKEIVRIRDCSLENKVPVEYVDRTIVLDRGLVMPAAGRGIEPKEESGVLKVWFFSLINFLDREAERRKAFPWDDYQVREKKAWKNILEPQYDAPSVVKLSEFKRKRKILKVISKKS